MTTAVIARSIPAGKHLAPSRSSLIVTPLRADVVRGQVVTGLVFGPGSEDLTRTTRERIAQEITIAAITAPETARTVIGYALSGWLGASPPRDDDPIIFRPQKDAPERVVRPCSEPRHREYWLSGYIVASCSKCCDSIVLLDPEPQDSRHSTSTGHVMGDDPMHAAGIQHCVKCFACECHEPDALAAQCPPVEEPTSLESGS